MIARLVPELALMLVALLSIQYPLVFARRLTMLPIAAAGLVTFLIVRAAGGAASTSHLLVAYAIGLAASIIASVVVLCTSEPQRPLGNLALSLIGVSASSQLILTLDVQGGTMGVNTRPFMLTPNGSLLTAALCLGLALAYWGLYAYQLRRPLYAAWAIASGGDAGGRLVPASDLRLVLGLAVPMGVGAWLVALINIHRAVVTASSLSYAFLFEVLAATLFTHAIAGLSRSRDVIRTRLWLSVSCVVGSLIITLLTDFLRGLVLGSEAATVGEMRQLVLWLLALVSVLAIPTLMHSRTQEGDPW